MSARHLAHRRIRRPPPRTDVLRHHPAAPLSVYRPGRARLPALVAAISDAEGRFTAVELTYLGPGGRRAVGLRLPRKTVGLVPGGSAVRLDPAGPELLVGEGVFTTLSASERFDLPAWALLSTRNLRNWRAPGGVRRVLIAADRGLDGLRSATLLAARLRQANVTASVQPPPEPYGDWNDAALAAALSGGEGSKGGWRRAGPGG